MVAVRRHDIAAAGIYLRHLREIWAGRAGIPHLPIQIHELAHHRRLGLIGTDVVAAISRRHTARSNVGLRDCGLALYAMLGSRVTSAANWRPITARRSRSKRQDDPFRNNLNTLAERQTDRICQYPISCTTAGVFVLTLNWPFRCAALAAL